MYLPVVLPDSRLAFRRSHGWQHTNIQYNTISVPIEHTKRDGRKNSHTHKHTHTHIYARSNNRVGSSFVQSHDLVSYSFIYYKTDQAIVKLHALPGLRRTNRRLLVFNRICPTHTYIQTHAHTSHEIIMENYV